MHNKINTLGLKKIFSSLAIFALLIQIISPVLAVQTNSLSNPWTIEKAEHLARKALFGASPDIVNTLYNAGSAEARVNILFPNTSGPDRTTYNNELNTFTSQTGFSITNSDWMKKYYAFKKYRDPYEAKAKAFVILEDIFSVNVDTYNGINYSDIENTHKLIYDNMFDSNYKNLIKKIVYNGQIGSGDYTMGQFLNLFNGQYPNSPNENYARELMQLFLMLEYKPWENQDSTGAVKNYTDSDIASLARILTGLESDSNTHQVSFNPNKHNTGSLVFLTGSLKSGDSFSFYDSASGTINSLTITNSISGNNGLTDNIIDYIFSKRESEIADFLAWRMLKYYVKDKPTQSEIENLASVIITNNFNLFYATKYLLSSNIMYSDEAMNTIYYKNPLELTIGTLKLLHYKNPSVIDPFIYDSSLLTNFEWTPYYPGSIFGRDGFDSNQKFFNSYNHNQWVNFSTKLAYYSNNLNYYNIDDILSVKRISETGSLSINTSTGNTYSGSISLTNISLTISGTVLGISNFVPETKITSEENVNQISEIPVLSEETTEETISENKTSSEEINSTGNILETTEEENIELNSAPEEIIPETTDVTTEANNSISTENISSELINETISTESNTGELEFSSSGSVKEEILESTESNIQNISSEINLPQATNQINFTNASVLLPNFSITTNDNSSINIASGSLNMLTKKINISSGTVIYAGNTYTILGGTADIDLSSTFERDINISEMISQFETYLYLGRKLPENVKTEIEKYLLTDDTGKSRLFLPNNTDYKNKYIRGVISMMLVQPEFVMNMGFDKNSGNSSNSSQFPSSNSKLVFVELYGGYDWLHAMIQKDNYDDYATKRGNLAIAKENLIDLGDYYLNPAYGALKPIYDSNNLRIVNRVGSTKHSRGHDTAAVQITSKYGLETSYTPSIIGNMIEQESDATKNIVLGTNSPNIYSNGNYLNIGGSDARYTSYASNLTSSGKTSQLQAIRNTLNSRTFPGDSANLFKGSITIDNVANTSKNSGGQPSSGYSLKQKFDFTKVLIDNNLGTTYYVPGGGGYDTHSDEVTSSTSDYDLTNRTTDLANELSSFWNNVKNKDVTVVVFSEFGRTLKTNGTLGTDHGQGGGMFLLSSNQTLLNSMPNKVIGNMNLAKEKSDWFGVGVDYRSIYNKILGSLYGISDTYLGTKYNLENDLSLDAPKVKNLNISHKNSNGTINNTIEFDVSGKNFDITNASNVVIKYGKTLDSLNTTISSWETQYSSNPIVKGNKIKFTKAVSGTGFAYEIKISNSQFVEKVLTGVLNLDITSTGAKIISPNKDTFIRNYSKNISGETDLGTDKILLGNTASGETLKTLTKGNGISLQLGSGSTYIEKRTGSGVWNGGFNLGSFIDKDLTISDDAITNSGEYLKNLNIEKIVKLGADTLGVGLKLDRNIAVEIQNLQANTKYKLIYSEDLLNWKNMNSLVSDSSGKLTFLTNHFTYFAIIQDVPDDIIPDNFSFISQTNKELSTIYESNSIIISGINTQVPISVTGGEYSINNGSFTGVIGTINNSDSVKLRLTSSANYSTTSQATLNIGGVTGNFLLTTKADPTIIIINPPTSNGGSSSSGGGGGGGLSKDRCPSGDYSPSYYDKSCGVKKIETNDNKNVSVIVNNKDYEKKYINYKGISILDIKNYLPSQDFRKQGFLVVKSSISESLKKEYINRLNALLVAKFALDTDDSMSKEALYNRYLKEKILLNNFYNKKIK